VALRIETNHSEDTMIITAEINNLVIGRAVVSKDENKWYLGDITVSDLSDTKIWYKIRALGTLRNYRGKGYGTQLLKTVIAKAKAGNVTLINGTVSGKDPARLGRWYTKHGFQVDHNNGNMVLTIKTE